MSFRIAHADLVQHAFEIGFVAVEAFGDDAVEAAAQRVFLFSLAIVQGRP